MSLSLAASLHCDATLPSGNPCTAVATTMKRGINVHDLVKDVRAYADRSGWTTLPGTNVHGAAANLCPSCTLYRQLLLAATGEETEQLAPKWSQPLTETPEVPDMPQPDCSCGCGLPAQDCPNRAKA